jgi:hypothetical protein
MDAVEVAVATEVVTKSGRRLPTMMLAGSLVLALGVWQVVNGPSTEPPNPDVSFVQVLARNSPSPTVRWETPPKFGGRGGDYSQVGADSALSAVAPVTPFRPGPYR